MAVLNLPEVFVYGILTHQRFAHAYMGAHRHAFTVGFVNMMIMGVAARVVPILAGVDARKLSGLWGPYGLHLRKAAIHKQLDSRDVAAVVGREKHHCFRDLIGCAQPAEWSTSRHHLLALLASL
jgi:hypothetical protein